MEVHSVTYRTATSDGCPFRSRKITVPELPESAPLNRTNWVEYPLPSTKCGITNSSPEAGISLFKGGVVAIRKSDRSFKCPRRPTTASGEEADRIFKTP